MKRAAPHQGVQWTVETQMEKLALRVLRAELLGAQNLVHLSVARNVVGSGGCSASGWPFVLAVWVYCGLAMATGAYSERDSLSWV
jgi:hypothetical protein